MDASDSLASCVAEFAWFKCVHHAVIFQIASRQMKWNIPTITPRTACNKTRAISMAIATMSSNTVIIKERRPRTLVRYRKIYVPKAHQCSTNIIKPYVTGKPHSANPNV
jgi:hypothetical protein